MAIKINKTLDSPEIHMDEDNSIFLIEGNSYPADVYKTYMAVFGWIKDYSHQIKDKLICEFKFNVLNSTSRKMVYEIISTLDKSISNQANVQIHWYYENQDDDIREIGEILAEQLKLPFRFFKTM